MKQNKKTSAEDKARRAAKIAAQQAQVQALSKSNPKSAVALAASHSLGRVASKNKGNTWMNVISGAAKVMSDLIPVFAPLLLAGHGPTALAASQAGLPPTPAGVPVASGMAVAPLVGDYGFKPTQVDSRTGKVNGMVFRGMDYLGDIVALATVPQGHVLRQIDLNPHSLDWTGTRAQIFARLYERYRFRRLALLYQPTVPATQAGQLVCFCDTDPSDTHYGIGRAGVQKASSHAGAEVGQVWQMITAEYVPDKKTGDQYSDPEGSDERLISPGHFVCQSASELAAAVYGSIYAIYEVEYVVSQIQSIPLEMKLANLVQLAGATTAIPLGVGTWEQLRAFGTLSGQYIPYSGGYAITGLHPGVYLWTWRCTAGAGLTAVTVSIDAVNYQSIFPSGTITATAANGMFILTVAKQTSDPVQGRVVFTTTGAVPATFAIYIAPFDDVLSATASLKNKTLQSIERDVIEMQGQMRTLVAASTAPSRPRRAAAEFDSDSLQSPTSW